MDEINAGNEEFDFQVLLAKANFAQLIVDYANKPMREGAEKYGYIFVCYFNKNVYLVDKLDEKCYYIYNILLGGLGDDIC